MRLQHNAAAGFARRRFCSRRIYRAFCGGVMSGGVDGIAIMLHGIAVRSGEGCAAMAARGGVDDLQQGEGGGGGGDDGGERVRKDGDMEVGGCGIDDFNLAATHDHSSKAMR